MYFVNLPGHSTPEQYSTAISDLRAMNTTCCNANVKNCCGKPFHIRFVSGRYAGRVYPVDIMESTPGGPLVMMQPLSTVGLVTCDV